MIELYLQNSKSGKVYNISNIVEDIKWQTLRVGKASTLTFSMISENISLLENGSIIRFKYNNKNIFYGYIFSIQYNQDNKASITAYDQVRYLLNKETYVFKAKRADQIIKRITSDFQLKVGNLANTKYLIPAMVEDSQSLIDIIYKALDLTLINTGKLFVFYDDFGKLVLRDIEDMRLPVIIGDSSLMTGYNYEQNIDKDSFNKIKLVKDNEKTGKREAYIVQDKSNIISWGTLQYYEKVSEKLNEAQIQERAKQLLSNKNRSALSLQLDAVGDLRIRAGNAIYINIKDLNRKQLLITDDCSHNFNGGQHTMSLTLKVI
ncbi:hypothetical protein IMX26_10605 [Clostridium sp. 'deep sea']|uniref:XkdQ/YqbQ family protein n=1 Tax=Clostridium sp. 'deep sea' TaxID=2779445 RepID=UPI0018968BA2|nr:hypothetical protein [Clostridium sp. 'deep sea']QOR33942.1 hypothetical protein IMX26_10605 [Clostridium sp. 'deep sea']